MDTLPLPPRPNLAQYRKRAKALVAAASSGDPHAVHRWAVEWLTRLTELLGVGITPFVQHSFDRAVAGIEAAVGERIAATASAGSGLRVAHAQHLIARAHGFDSWSAFAAHVRGLGVSDPATADFEAGADAVVDGDLERLDALLREHPSLVRQRSHREHRATLLHYVAANGVEDFRQRTPPDAVAVATRLLDAGAGVDALAETYGGGVYQTPMNLLVSSTHPAEAGLQSALVEVLLDYGAAIDGLDGNGSPILTALAFGYRDAADTLARRGARIDHVVVAAAIGRVDLVEAWVIDGRTLATHHQPYRGPYWVRIPDEARQQIEMALVWACRFGRDNVARALLHHGVDPAARDGDRMTALHWAAASGSIEIVDALLTRGAPLEVPNVWGGTVLDSTVYFAMHQPMAGANYPRIIERLLAAGANVAAVDPSGTGIQEVDQVLAQWRTP